MKYYMNNKEALQKAYALLSPYADKQLWEFSNNIAHLRYITRYIPKTASILDIGCGIGILDLALIFLGYKVAGIDKYIFEANNSFSIDDSNGLRRIWNKQGLVIDAKDVLRDNIKEQYGAIISIATIEHQKDPKRFLENLLGALKPGGLLYIATPNISHLLNRARLAFGLSPLSGHLEEWFKKGESFEGHWREYTRKELKQMFSWLDIMVLFAKNKQSMPLAFKLATPRSWYVGILRLLARLLPGTGDNNIVIGKKRFG